MKKSLHVNVLEVVTKNESGIDFSYTPKEMRRHLIDYLKINRLPQIRLGKP